MKNICSGLILGAGMTMLVLLPQVSFGVNAVSTACNQQQDAKSVAFFQQQAQERAAFIKANQNIIAKQDLIGKWLMAQKDAQSGKSGNTFSEPSPPPLSSEVASVVAAFMQKQQSDKQAFFSSWPRQG